MKWWRLLALHPLAFCEGPPKPGACARGSNHACLENFSMRQIKRRTTNTPIAPQPDDDDPIPENIDDFRNELARRISRFIGNRTRAWRGCPERACRRAQHCRPPQIRCSNAPALPPRTPEQQARAMAQLQRLLRERLEQDGARNDAAGK
jgi:hypothetical protein